MAASYAVVGSLHTRDKCVREFRHTKIQVLSGKITIHFPKCPMLLQVMALCKHKGIKTINVVRRDSGKQEVLDAGYGFPSSCFSRLI